MNKNVIGTIALSALMLGLAPAVMSQVFATIEDCPGCQGGGHDRELTQSCSDPKFADRPSCPGSSEDAQGNDREDEECTTVFAGNSENVKATDC
jgi:hypothetical protein